MVEGAADVAVAREEDDDRTVGWEADTGDFDEDDNEAGDEPEPEPEPEPWKNELVGWCLILDRLLDDAERHLVLR